MQRLKHREIRRRALYAIEKLRWIAEHAELIADSANDAHDDGITGANYEGDGRGGAELTGPERRGEERARRDAADDVHQRMIQIMDQLDQANVSARDARSTAGKLVTSREERDRAAQRRTSNAVGTVGSGSCENCTAWCPGERDDRLRGGRCKPCWDYKRDHHGNERPRELWEKHNAFIQT